MIDPATHRSFATLVSAAYADGRISEDERLVLHRKATEMDIPVRDMNEIIDQGQQGKLVIAVPATTREREALLDSLIDVVCADGRIEPPEHHLLAKFSSHLKLSLPDLRQRVKERMEKRPARPSKIEPKIRETKLAPAPAPAPDRHEIAAAPAAPAAPGGASAPLLPPGPVQLDGPKLMDPKIADIPPVTLQLIKQAIAFETDEDAGRHVERMLGVPRDQAQRILAAVLAAFPDLKPNVAPPPPRPRR